MTRSAKSEAAPRVRRPVVKKAKAAASRGSPLAYLLSVMRDEAQTPAARMAAAKSAAPYLHVRVAAVEERKERLDRASEKLVSLVELALKEGRGVAGLVKN